MTAPSQTGPAPCDVPSRLPSLTGMRFIAAMLVFMFHAINANLFSSPDAQHIFSNLFEQGASGVGFFFVLSGFVITWSRRAPYTARSFWRRRFFKIYPNHFVTFVVAYLLITVGAKMAVAPHAAVLNLLLIQSWFPDLRIAYSVNVVSWSLSCEVLFYLAFPLLAILVDRVRPELLWRWAAGTTAAIIAVSVLAASLLPASPIVPETGMPLWQQWLVDLFPPSRLLECFFGMLMAKIVMARRFPRIPLTGALSVAVAGYLLAPLLPKIYGVAAVLVVPFGLVIASGAVTDVAGRSSWLSSRIMVRLGEISFAFYLWHLLVMIVMRPTLSTGPGWRTPGAIGVLLLFFGITVTLAWLLFTFVERPVTRRFSTVRTGARRVTPGERSPAHVPAASTDS